MSTSIPTPTPTTTTPTPPIPLGTKTTYTTAVLPTDLASEIIAGDTKSTTSEDAFPRVLATSRLIAFLEIAAARALHPILKPGQLSVGTRVDVAHSAPTPVGAEVVATAEFVRMSSNGKGFVFEVEARDEAGVVGSGVHERAVVDVARLEGGAEKRRRRKEE